MELVLPSPVEAVQWQIAGRSYRVFVKRDDLIHPTVSGNKWRKLRLVLDDARRAQKNTLVSFGGAWSNHLLALAVSAEALDFKSVAFVRGDELGSDTHGQLARFRRHGMDLLPVSRAEYRDKTALFNKHFGEQTDAYFIDEGGASALAELGCRDILAEDPMLSWDDIWLAVGTGTTIKGIAKYLAEQKCTSRLHGVLAVQSETFRLNLLAEIVRIYPHVQLYLPKNGPRFGKFSAVQLEKALAWHAQTNILPDPVYGLKTLESLHHSLEIQNPTDIGRVLWIHTGGLQGWAGQPETLSLFRQIS